MNAVGPILKSAKRGDVEPQIEAIRALGLTMKKSDVARALGYGAQSFITITGAEWFRAYGVAFVADDRQRTPRQPKDGISQAQIGRELDARVNAELAAAKSHNHDNGAGQGGICRCAQPSEGQMTQNEAAAILADYDERIAVVRRYQPAGHVTDADVLGITRRMAKARGISVEAMTEDLNLALESRQMQAVA